MTVHRVGPFFEGDAGETLKLATQAASRDIAETLLITWYVKLDSAIQVNQNRYLSGLTRDRNDDYTWRVHDDIGKVYGPWLEGIGSQNPRSTFKGYHALREANAEVSGQAYDIADENIAEAVKELGGS